MTVANAGPPQGPEPVYTVSQVAAMSHKSRGEIYRLMGEGVITFVVPNGCTKPKLVPKSAYERWMGLG